MCLRSTTNEEMLFNLPHSQLAPSLSKAAFMDNDLWATRKSWCTSYSLHWDTEGWGRGTTWSWRHGNWPCVIGEFGHSQAHLSAVKFLSHPQRSSALYQNEVQCLADWGTILCSRGVRCTQGAWSEQDHAQLSPFVYKSSRRPKKDSPLTQFTLFSIAQSQWPDAYKSWSCKLSSPGGAAGPGSVLNCLENPLPAQVYLAWWAHALTECHTFIPASSKNLHSPRGPAILKHLKCICIEFILSTFTSREPVSNLLCFLYRNTRKSPASIVSLMHNNPSGQAQLGGSCSQDKAELQQGHLKVCVYRVSIGACRCWLHHLSIQLLVLQF